MSKIFPVDNDNLGETAAAPENQEIDRKEEPTKLAKTDEKEITEIDDLLDRHHRHANIATPKKSIKQRPIPANPPGLHKNVTNIIGDDDVLEKVKGKLLEGEEIMDSFNVFMPEGMMPMWKVYFLCFITCGLALFYFAYRAFLRFLYNHKWLYPTSVGFSRGVMIVTSYGRLLVWNVDAIQKKEADMVSYNWKNPQHPKNYLKACVDFIKVVTLNYKLINMRETCAPPMSYKTSTFFGSYHVGELRQLSVLSTATAPCFRMCCCCPYFTSSIALCFTGATTEDIGSGYGDLSVGIEPVWYWSNYLNELLRGLSGDGGSNDTGLLDKPKTPHTIFIDMSTSHHDTVHQDDCAKVVEELSDIAKQVLAHNKVIKPVFSGECTTQEDIFVPDTNASIVHTGGKVTIPAPYFPLLPGESILTVHGQMYRAKFIDWIMTLFTFGLWYVFFIRPKRYNRTAFLVTTHRIAEIIISQREGCVPSHGANYSFAARSFFPRSIQQHGFVTRSRNRVSGGVVTDFGPISLTFDLMGREDAFDDFQHFFKVFNNNDKYPVYNVKKPELEVNLSGVEAGIISLQKGEFVIGRFQGDNNWRPLWPCETCCNADVTPCYPWIPWLLCLTLRPRRQVSSIVITNRCVYFLSAITNYTCNCCALRDAFNMAYAPLKDFVGVATHVDSVGAEWCARRMWQWVCCCDAARELYPINMHTYFTDASFSSGVHIAIHGGPVAFRPTEEMDAFDMVVARAQKAIFDDDTIENA